MNLTADVVVVGGGFTGLSAALHLAEDGAKVVVLEAEEIGFGGSGRNVGLVNAGMWAMPAVLPVELGETFGPRLLDQLGNAPSLVFDLVRRFDMDCQAVQKGTLHCAANAKGLQEITERAKQWQALHAPVELLDAQQTADKIGTKAYAGSLLDRRAGTIQPLAYVRGLAAATLSLGASIYTSSPVVDVEDLGKAWRVSTPSGAVTAPWVIAATNAYSINVWNSIPNELVKLPYFNLATAPLSENIRRTIIPDGEGIWDTQGILTSLRLDQAGRLVFGSVGALRGAGTRIHRNWGRRALAKLFPHLSEIEFEHEWYGWIGMTGNALPRFHRLARNTISFSGYNGRGIAPGTVFGRDLARLASGQITEDDLSLPVTEIENAHFRNAKGAFYEFGAQIAHAAGARV